MEKPYLRQETVIKMQEKSDNVKSQAEVKVTASVLDAFDLLKAVKDEAKLNGGSKIISHLQLCENEKDLKYVLKRLVRSLGANMPDVRAGYFATLVALLSNFEQISITQLLELVKKELHSNGSSKSEVGDVALGQILVCGAIFRSGCIFKCNHEEHEKIIQLLLAAGKKKSYLSTVAYIMLLDFVIGIDVEQFGTVIWPIIKPEFKKDIKEYTLDTLYFLMAVCSKFPEKVKLRKLIGTDDIFCEDNIHTICERIMTGIDLHSSHHPIYKEIGLRIANSPQLRLFWISGIDSQLVKHNRNRELVAVNMLTVILNNITHNTEVIPELISRNFFKLFMDWFKGLQTASKIRSKQDYEDDNKMMIKKQKELLNVLAKTLKSDKVSNSVRVELLKKLLFYPGEINFTEITGTTIVKSIIADLDKDNVKKMAKLFKCVLLNTSKKFVKDNVERNWYNNERVKAAELLSYLVSHEALKDDTEFKLSYMKLLMCFGFFKVSGDETVTISTELSSSIKSCFYRCFTSRFSTIDNLVTVLSSLCSFICHILQKDKVRIKIEKQFPQENMNCWEMVMEVCQNIEKNDIKSKVDNVFLILLYQLGLFLFSEPAHVKIAKSSIKELKSCYEHYRKGKKKKPKVSKEGDVSSVEPEWIEVIVEVLLSILSAESSVLRSVVQCVFRLLWEYLTPSSIGQIVSVLDPENESNPLTQYDSDSENDEDHDDEAKLNGENSDVESGESDEESDIETEDEDDGDVKTPDQLRIAVQKALGAAALDSDAESVDADMIDEEEGKKLDAALAEAFKQFHQVKGKKSKKDRKDKKALSDFRIRVLDLVDIYLEKDPSMDICLGMIAPLTRCLEFCIQDNQFNELENRVRKTIKILTKIRKFSSVEDINIEILSDYMKATIDKGVRSHFLFQALGDVITFFATFIIHCSLKTKQPESQKKGKTSPLVDILKTSLQNYFQNRNCMLPIIFFHNVLQTEWYGSYELLPIIIENVFSNNVRHFRRNEGLELISGYFRALKRNKPTSDKAVSDLLNLEDIFETTLIKNLKSGSEFIVKKNFLVILKKLINTIKMFHESCKVQTKLDFKVIFDIIGSHKPSINTSNTQVSEKRNKLSKKSKKKRKMDQTNGNTEPVQKKLKKSSDAVGKF